MSKPQALCNWHEHPFEEFCLSTDSATCTGQAGERIDVPPNVLFYFGRGVTHGYWNNGAQSPRFWVLHFAASAETRREFSFLREATRSFWLLSPAQVATFKHCYMRIFLEHTQPRGMSLEAVAAWLRLLLIEVQRWSEAKGNGGAQPFPVAENVEIIRLWQLINQSVGEPAELGNRLRAAFPNYDSLRHAFKTAYGCSPKKMFLTLRIQQAKNLLLETRLSIKEIAAQVGYPEQHEFARTFKKLAGVSPSEWRAHPATLSGLPS